MTDNTQKSTILRVPLNVVVTETGHVTEGVLVAVMVADLDGLEAKNANQARMIEGYREDNLETKCEQIKILCEDHSGKSGRMLARDILEVLDGE